MCMHYDTVQCYGAVQVAAHTVATLCSKQSLLTILEKKKDKLSIIFINSPFFDISQAL